MIRRSGILFVLVAVVFPGVCSCLIAGSSEAPLQAMILTGQCNHNWRMSTPILMRILEQSGLFEAYPVIAPAEGSESEMERFRPDFARYDVVVLHYVGDRWPEAVDQAFVEYVKSGGGVVAIHSACNAFPDWPQYNRILGLGGWYGRDEKWGPYIRWQGGRVIRDMSPGDGGSHPDKHAFTIVTRNSEHPVMKGLPARWLHTRDGLNIEMRGPAEDLTVLATAYADPAISGGTGEHEPIIFTVRYGKGRVFHTLLGHANNLPVSGMECVGFISTLQRGAQWAATGNVTQAVPKDFPTAREVRRWKDCEKPKSPADGAVSVQFERISSWQMERSGPGRVRVRLSEKRSKPVNVHYVVRDGSAEQGEDYVLAGRSVTFEPGEVVKEIMIQVMDNSEHGPAKTVVLCLSEAVGAVLGANVQHTYTIIDDDGVDWDGKTWYYSEAPTALFINGQGQLEWEPRDDEHIVVKLPEQQLSEPGDVAEFSYLWLSDGPTTDCNCHPYSGCIDDDVTCTAGTGDFRAGLFDSHGSGYVTADGMEGEVFRGYRGYKFYISPHVSSKVGRFRDHTGEVHISGGIYKRKDPDGDTMLLSKNNNYRRLRIDGGFELPLNTFSPLTIRMERLSRTSLKISITLNGITYTTIDDEAADQPQKIDVFAITFPNARNYTRWVLAGPE